MGGDQSLGIRYAHEVACSVNLSVALADYFFVGPFVCDEAFLRDGQSHFC